MFGENKQSGSTNNQGAPRQFENYDKRSQRIVSNSDIMTHALEPLLDKKVVPLGTVDPHGLGTLLWLQKPPICVAFRQSVWWSN